MASRRSRIQVRPNLGRGTPGAASAARSRRPDGPKAEAPDNLRITEKTTPDGPKAEAPDNLQITEKTTPDGPKAEAPDNLHITEKTTPDGPKAEAPDNLQITEKTTPDEPKAEAPDNLQITEKTTPATNQLSSPTAGQDILERPSISATENEISKKSQNPEKDSSPSKPTPVIPVVTDTVDAANHRDESVVAVTPSVCPVSMTTDSAGHVPDVTASPLETDVKSKPLPATKAPPGGRRSRIKPQVQIRPGKLSAGKPTRGKSAAVEAIEVVRDDVDKDSNDVAPKGTVTSCEEAAKPSSHPARTAPPKTETPAARDETPAARDETPAARDEHAIKEVTGNDNTQEPSTTHEVVKSPVKRSRFTRAKPNFLEAERRRQRYEIKITGEKSHSIV